MGTEHSIEEVEHAAHHASQPWEKNVAVSMAIVAAALAFVTLLSHRSHNDVLRFQGESNQLWIESGIFHTRASDQWAFYQAKNGRQHAYKMMSALLESIPGTPDTATKRDALKGEWGKQLEKYDHELPEMKTEAEKLVKEGEESQAKAKETLEKSHHIHGQADKFDLAELLVEMSLVLCSLTVLTKKKSFWVLGLTVGAFGVGLALMALNSAH